MVIIIGHLSPCSGAKCDHSGCQKLASYVIEQTEAGIFHGRTSLCEAHVVLAIESTEKTPQSTAT